MDHSSVVSGGIVRLVRARLYYPRLMSRPFEKVTLADAVGRLRPGMKVLLPAGCAPLVIAQVNPRMPRTLGNAFLHRSQIDCWAEAEHPLTEYPPTPVGDVERGIAERVADLVPDGSTVQVGVGSIPQAVMEA